LIGRKKHRNFELNRALLASGMSFRKCAMVANCSHGSIFSEKQTMKHEEVKLKQKLAEEEKLKREFGYTIEESDTMESTKTFPKSKFNFPEVSK